MVLNGIHRHRNEMSPTIAMHIDDILELVWIHQYAVYRSILNIKMRFYGHWGAWVKSCGGCISGRIRRRMAKQKTILFMEMPNGTGKEQ